MAKPNIPGAKNKTNKKQQTQSAKEEPKGLPNEQDEVFEEDFTDEDGSGGFKLASEGFHPAKVIDFEKSYSKTGNPTYVWQFLITAGDSEGVELRFWTSLLPQARWKTVETLEAVGIEAAGSMARFKRSDVVGSPCVLEVIHDEYEGRTNHKVERVHPADEEAMAAIGDEDVPF